MENAAVVRLELVAEGGDPDQFEEEFRFLIADVSQLEVGSVRPVPCGPPPPGARSGGALQTGAVLVGLGGSGALLPALAALARDWVRRRGSGTLKLTIGSDTIELTGVTGEVQQQALDDFLRRHRTPEE